jgi:hypothetical protein
MFVIAACERTRFVPRESPYSPDPGEIWPLIAKSHFILTGTLSAPIQKIRACQESNQHEYLDLDVKKAADIKGVAKDKFSIRWYSEPRSYAPTPDRIISLHNKSVILFLIQVDDPVVRGLYFAGYTQDSLLPEDQKRIGEIESEVQSQRSILSTFQNLFPRDQIPYLDEVKCHIDKTTSKSTQVQAFENLVSMGARSVPAIITLMDDRRDLGTPGISFKAPPDHWEGIIHYGPEKVVDLMEIVLGRVTKESFGNLENGGSTRERTEAVNAWRIYLYYALQ